MLERDDIKHTTMQCHQFTKENSERKKETRQLQNIQKMINEITVLLLPIKN